MATRKPKPPPKEPFALLQALQFISVAQNSEGLPFQTHCRIADGTVTASNGGISAGVMIDDNLRVCPQTAVLLSALSKCTEAIAITELDSGRLSVKSGKFRALVPCIPFIDLPTVNPDPPCATVTDAVKTALQAVAGLVQDNSADPLAACVLLQANSAVSTNRHVILEAWHGIDLPPNIQIPKGAIQAICRKDKALKAFGFSDNSATFYYEDDSFIKTALFAVKFPNFNGILADESNANPWPFPAGFYEALEKVASFSEDKFVYFDKNLMKSHANPSSGATYELEGLPGDMVFNIEYLKLIKTHAQRIHFNYNTKGMAVFFGDGVRGAIARINR
jgi:DNA polymerase III sliding clamp (beta) subunit (PCNA family)